MMLEFENVRVFCPSLKCLPEVEEVIKAIQEHDREHYFTVHFGRRCRWMISNSFDFDFPRLTKAPTHQELIEEIHRAFNKEHPCD